MLVGEWRVSEPGKTVPSRQTDPLLEYPHPNRGLSVSDRLLLAIEKGGKDPKVEGTYISSMFG